MKVELRNVKHAAFASEETYCFEATVYIDGVKAGSVSNDGQGGAHRWSPWALEQRLDEYAATLPSVTTSFIDPKTGQPFVYQQNGESLVSDLVSDWLIARDVKRALSKRILFVREGQLRQVSPPASQKAFLLGGSPAQLEALKAKLQTTTILNLLPFDEAVKIYRETAEVQS